MTRDEILSCKCPVISHTVKEWGAVNLRVMSMSERFAWIATMTDDDSAGNMCRLLVRCFCDESGARIFTDDEWTLLVDKDGSALDELSHKALELNRVGFAAKDKDVKNS